MQTCNPQEQGCIKQFQLETFLTEMVLCLKFVRAKFLLPIKVLHATLHKKL